VTVKSTHIETDGAGHIVHLKRIRVGGSLESNMESVTHQIISLKDTPSRASKLLHLNAIHKVAE